MKIESVQIRLTLPRAVVRALDHIARDQYPAQPFLEQTAMLLIVMAQANYHLIRPHIESLSAYCRLEGADFGAELAAQLDRAFPAKKKKGKK